MNSNFDADVLVIGGGPAGISAAVALRRNGVKRVIIIEREPEMGGIPRHCGHPPFGMREFGRILSGPDYARRLAQLAREHQIEAMTNTTVISIEPDATLLVSNQDGLRRLKGQRVIMATGVRESPRSALLVSGDRPTGVLNTGALQSWVYLRGLLPFKRPLIVGTELVSISALLTCRKAGIKPVAMVEANGRPTTRRPFTLLPRLLGVPLHYNCEVVRIEGIKRVESVQVRHEGIAREIPCDGVLFTGQFIPDSALIRGSHLRLDPASGGPEIDQFSRCSDPSYYATGNMLRALETAGWSFREGKRVGEMVASDLAGERKLAEGCIRLVLADKQIKWVVPQRIVAAEVGRGMDNLQLRALQSTQGELQLIQNGNVIWRKEMTLLPERRILIPLQKIPLADSSGQISILLKNNC
ncbi:NAD(P)/FAD-dependent oxidoreductase [[Enterobacter] lignolyticus]|uniref:Pyridine nucleotide-disulfide oxidoreductase n=1 Tax=[Enterobacter] lignolyticus TaxID=1334193 RepID=A0A806X8Z2_9ENTR|nr:FAD/NAD(P)-binding oxidoreductase [[Enterobacter] lignolyticus]ALR78045.1 pyridine nucleotide-disulfide oxidoreductase [[Enterobacter] lignolyticus]